MIGLKKKCNRRRTTIRRRCSCFSVTYKISKAETISDLSSVKFKMRRSTEYWSMVRTSIKPSFFRAVEWRNLINTWIHTPKLQGIGRMNISIHDCTREVSFVRCRGKIGNFLFLLHLLVICIHIHSQGAFGEKNDLDTIIIE